MGVGGGGGGGGGGVSSGRGRAMSKRARAFGAASDEDGGDAMIMDDGGASEEMAMDSAMPVPEMMLMNAASSESSESSAGSAEPMMRTPPQALGLSSTDVSSGTTSTLFGVRRPATIPSDGQPHKLVIGAVAVTPVFAYKATPRAAAAAFLTVTGRNDSPYPLLPGPVRVFLDGAFTTTSRLPLVAPGDKLDLGLGIDPGIRVTSDPVRTRDENRGSSLLGNEARRRAVTHRAVVRNVKLVAVDVEVTDVFPRSEHKELKVTLSEKTSEPGGSGGGTGGAAVPGVTVSVVEDPVNGKVTWKVHLPPGAEQVLHATHRIEWPKGKEYVQRAK
mmetsp:Transcript_26941/g.66031  ORF Transcript_26941/g.66031 Transcript_26941/m.66031 type:complete len:331 (+) Transcript_26941:2-994(+)